MGVKTPALEMRKASGKSQKPSADRKFPVRLEKNMTDRNRNVNSA